MEKFSKSIEGIRKMLKDLKGEKYALVNPELVELDEYVKGLYLKVLCTVVQYKNDPADMQVLFLKRIVNGIGVDDSLEEYMRKALEISEADIQEFLSVIGNNHIKYYFATDGLILSSMGNGNADGYEYLAEIIELLGINKNDLEYVCTIVKSILQQDSSYYNQSKELVNERVEKLDFTPYIRNYYAGAIVDSKAIVHYSAPDRKLSSDIIYRTEHTENKIVFQNLDINILTAWKFEGCEEVLFENCKIKGSSFSIFFLSCKKVVIRESRFEDFKVPVFNEQELGEFIIENCKFENCFTEYSRSTDDWKVLGGVIYTDNANRTAKNIISKTVFKNCGGKNKNNYYSSAIISNCKSSNTECSFYNCWNYYNNTQIDPENNMRTLFMRGTESTNNEIVGSANFC